jgi:HTH-type transcriptional regulator, sugar sensing transcriptional regulator
MEFELKDGTKELKALGFTQLESEIYVQLLGASASSGYAIAQAISKPAANVYKALNSLEKKGAVLIEEGATRLCIPVPVDELLNALQNTFNAQKERAGQFLRQIGKVDEDDKIYRLNQVEQVFEKCRTLLGLAEKTVLIDAFNAALLPLQNEIQQTLARGVQIALQAYEPIELPGLRIFQNPRGESIRENWTGLWLNMVVDSQNFIMAYLSPDLSEVYQAVWSSSRYMTWIYRSALVAEQQLSELKGRLLKTNDLKSIRELVIDMDTYFNVDVPGYHELQNKYQTK